MLRYFILLQFCLLFSSSFKDAPCEETRLFQKAPFPIGAALNTDKLKNEEKYWTTALAQFNSFTPERILKPQYIHPKKEVFDFSETDHLIDFCREYNIRLHGHTLVWHKSLPVWVENFKGSKEEWESILKNHIQTVIGHCKGYIKSWDVVNEAFNDDGTLRKNIWLKNIGETYIEKSFLYASQVDSSVKLFYNDYSIEKEGVKLTAILNTFKSIRAKGIRVDGIGMQMHVTLEYPAISEINQAASLIQKAGFLVHYSELDVRVNADRKLFVSNKTLMDLQKSRMKEIVSGYMKIPKESQFGITLWGVSDNDSWLTEERLRSKPLLYNTNYKIKPAYCGFLQALQEKIEN